MAFLQCTIQRSGTRGNDNGCDDAFGIAVRIATLICYLLMTRLQNRPVVSGFSSGGFGWVGGLISMTAEAISSGAEMITPQPVIRALQTTVAE
jgi:hypothetical protein